MNEENMMLIPAERAATWRLSADRKTVRLALPPLPIAGQPEPIKIYVDFNADTIDATLERLSILRGQMLPPLAALSQFETLRFKWACLSKSVTLSA
jgi:hypothetical protein